MKKTLLLLICLIAPLFGSWQMFSDGKDTYIYNTVTGEIYIRFKMNGKNYQDVFVKMPKGVIPKDEKTLPSSSSKTPESNDTALEAIKKANDLMNRSIDSGGL